MFASCVLHTCRVLWGQKFTLLRVPWHPPTCMTVSVQRHLFQFHTKAWTGTNGLAATLPACLFPLPGHKFVEGSDYLCIPVMPGTMPFLHIRSFIEFNWRDEMYLLKTIYSAHKHKHGNRYRKQNGLLSWCGPANLSDFKYIMALSPLSNFL